MSGSTSWCSKERLGVRRKECRKGTGMKRNSVMRNTAPASTPSPSGLQGGGREDKACDESFCYQEAVSALTSHSGYIADITNYQCGGVHLLE